MLLADPEPVVAPAISLFFEIERAGDEVVAEVAVVGFPLRFFNSISAFFSLQE